MSKQTRIWVIVAACGIGAWIWIQARGPSWTTELEIQGEDTEEAVIQLISDEAGSASRKE